jgi:hypothetical protein
LHTLTVLQYWYTGLTVVATVYVGKNVCGPLLEMGELTQKLRFYTYKTHHIPI